jgi:hypothetical protein
MDFEIVPKALGQELREELNYMEKLAVVMALEQGVVIPSRSGFLKTLSESQRNALCVLLQANNKHFLIRFFKPTTEEARASQVNPASEYAVVRALR